MQKRHLIAIAVLAVIVALSVGYYFYHTYTLAHSSNSDTAQVRMTVTSFGDRLQQVPLVAPKEIVAFAMDKYYAVYVHPDLLAKWKADPLNAPGRTLENTWPDNINVESIVLTNKNTYKVEAFIVNLTDIAGGETRRDLVSVEFVVSRGPDGWQITDYHKKK